MLYEQRQSLLARPKGTQGLLRILAGKGGVLHLVECSDSPLFLLLQRFG